MSRLTPAATEESGFYERRTEKHLEKIVDRLGRAFFWLADSDVSLGRHFFDLAGGGGNAHKQVG